MSTDPSHFELEPATLQEWLARDDVLLVDVRPAGMHEAERIAGSRAIPLASLELNSLEGIDGKKIVMQCQAGVASVRACHKLRAQGFVGELFNLTGGLNAWKSAGLPTEGTGGGMLRSLISKFPFGHGGQR